MPPRPDLARRRFPPFPHPYRGFVRHFNRVEFRACVDPLEALYFRRGRSTFYQGLIQLAVALLQLRLGMIRGPRVLLASARRLLVPYAPRFRGLNVAAVIGLIDATLARLPAGVVKLDPAEIAALALPALRLSLRGPRSKAYRQGCRAVKPPMHADSRR